MYIAAILLIFAAFICTGEFLYVSHSADVVTHNISKSFEYYISGDKNCALKYALEADKIWNQKASKIDMLLYHDYVDEITQDINNIKICVLTDNKQMIFTTYVNALSKVKSLKKSEMPTLENII